MSADVRKEDAESVVSFSPPLYKQRYQLVADVIHRCQYKSVIDFGCSECQIFRDLLRVASLEVIHLVDKDSDVLERNKYQIRPWTIDYLQRRKNPLSVHMYAGDVTDMDSRVMGTDVVTLVEVIEHLPAEVLQRIPEAVFGKLHPRLVIITTPNSEFNVLFPNLSGFRHWDHKFEWSRSKFQQWCDELASVYGYSVEYMGLGDPPHDQSHLGPCTQIAVFSRDDITQSAADGRENSLIETTHPYKLVSECIHPHCTSRLSEEEQLVLDISYHLRQRRRYSMLYNKRLSESEEDISNLTENSSCDQITIESLFKYSSIHQSCSSVEKLTEFLLAHDYILTDNHQAVQLPLEESEESSSDDEDDDMEDDRHSYIGCDDDNISGGDVENGCVLGYKMTHEHEVWLCDNDVDDGNCDGQVKIVSDCDIGDRDVATDCVLEGIYNVPHEPELTDASVDDDSGTEEVKVTSISIGYDDNGKVVVTNDLVLGERSRVLDGVNLCLYDTNVDDGNRELYVRNGLDLEEIRKVTQERWCIVL